MSVLEPGVRFTRDAQQDYTGILLYTHRTWGFEQRETYRTAILRTLSQLRVHPLLGRPRDDLFSGCRSIRVNQHVIYYHQPGPAEIVIVRILHSRREATGVVALGP